MSHFIPVARLEMGKALGKNPWFWSSLAVGCSVALFSAFQDSVIFQGTLDYALRHWDEVDSLYSAASCFAFWMPLDTYELGPGVFSMAWPLLAVIPYAWSWCAEHRGGMLAQQCARAGRGQCVWAKLLATFVSGGLAVGVPYLVNLVACACFAPATPVWVSDILYLGVTSSAPLSSLFYTSPLVFCLVWTLVAAVVAGLWAMLVSALSALAGVFLQVAVSSYLLCHLAAYVGSQLSSLVLTFSGRAGTPSALISLDLFSIVGVRSVEGATEALILTVLLLLVSCCLVSSVQMRRDVL